MITEGTWAYDAERKLVLSDAADASGSAPALVAWPALTGKAPGEADANGALLAAAKKLLAACKAQREAIDSLSALVQRHDRGYDPRGGGVWDALMLANAAIDAAEGGGRG